MEKLNININSKNSLTDVLNNAANNNYAKINQTGLESSPDIDTFENSSKKDKKKLITLGVVLAAVGAIVFAVKKGVLSLPSKVQPQGQNLPPAEKLQPTEKEEAAIENIVQISPASEKITPAQPEVPTIEKIETQEVPTEKIITQEPPAQKIQQDTPAIQETPTPVDKTQQETVSVDTAQEKISPTQQEIKTQEATQAAPDEKTVQKVQEAVPEVGFKSFQFSEKTFESLENYKKSLFSKNPQTLTQELANECLKEQKAIEQAYEILDDLWEKAGDNEKIKDELRAEFKRISTRYKELDFVKTGKEIEEFKRILDEYDPESYKKLVAQTEEKFGDNASKYYSLRQGLISEIGKRRFKTSPVFDEIVKAADKLGIEGSDEEKFEKMLKKASEDFIGAGEEGSVFRIPETNLVIKTKQGRLSTVPTQDINNFEYIADLYEYEAVNNVLARSPECEIQEYIDGLQCLLFNEDAQTVISNMPQKAYDDFLERMVRINKAGRGIDTGGANLMVDAVNQRFIPIDLHPNTSFEARCRTSIDDLGRNKIDPLAHTIGQFPMPRNEESGKKQIGKILKSIAKDTKNHEMYLFDTGFYQKNNPTSTIIEQLEYSSIDKKLATEVDEAFRILHQTKLELAKSTDSKDKEKLSKAIDDFCAFIDEKLLSDTPDIEPSELAQMQTKINKRTKINELETSIKRAKKQIEKLSKKENPTPEQIQDKLEWEQDLKELSEKLEEINNS